MTDQEESLIRRIAKVVGHELRNPLAVINNSAYFLKAKLGAGGALDPKVEKHLGIIAAEIARADGLVAEILAFSRPLDPKPQAQPLNELLAAALAARSFPANISVEKLPCASNPSAKADAELFKAALGRVLDNAVEAMPSGGILRVAVSEQASWGVVEVKDAGPGIAEEILAAVFEPFVTAKPRGLGLGLALARKILAAHGGRIEAANDPGGGAVVRLFLPSIR